MLRPAMSIPSIFGISPGEGFRYWAISWKFSSSSVSWAQAPGS